MTDFFTRNAKRKKNENVGMRKKFKITNRTNRLQHLMAEAKFMKKTYYDVHYVLLMLKTNNFIRHQATYFQKEILVIEKLHASTPNFNNINGCITMAAKNYICFDKQWHGFVILNTTLDIFGKDCCCRPWYFVCFNLIGQMNFSILLTTL